MGPFPAEGRRGGELGESRPILESNCVFAFRDDSPRGAPSLSPFFQGDPWLTPILERDTLGSSSTQENSSMETTLFISHFHLLTPET